jgi:hypothetical protein
MLDRGIANLKQFADPLVTDPSSRVEHVPLPESGPSRMILPQRMSAAGERRHAGAEQVDGF